MTRRGENMPGGGKISIHLPLMGVNVLGGIYHVYCMTSRQLTNISQSDWSIGHTRTINLSLHS